MRPRSREQSARSDRRAIYAAAFLRALATGSTGVLLGLYLPRLALGPSQLGLVISAGLAGGALAVLAVMLHGDRLGRRRTLAAAAVLTGAGAVAVALASHPLAIGVFAFLGMLNGMGRDRGAALVLEQAILPATAGDAERTSAFAWYNVVQDAGHALGGLLAAAPELVRAHTGLSELASLRALVVLGGVLHASSAAIYLRLSAAVEVPKRSERERLPRETRRVVGRISALFALDSLGGGFLTSALLAYFFFERFFSASSAGGAAAIGILFFAARLANMLSHLGAAWLARRIGLVNTMVLTHVPSSLLLVTVGFAPSFPVAAVLFLLRESLVEMDVPTRQSYVMALVPPEHRSFASGVTHLVRLGGWAVAPAFAGLLMGSVSLMTPLVAGAGLKLAYDGLLYAGFRKLRPPEERR